jgi:hypothetical protein
MAIHSRYSGIGLLLSVGMVLGSCGDPPSAPNLPKPPNPTMVVVSLAMTVPSDIEPGASVQLRATATTADGAVSDVTNQTRWSVTDSKFVQVSATGLATGKTLGETAVIASFSGLSARSQVFVLPKGTFALRGSLTDSGFGIDYAHVTVISGVGSGLTMMTRHGGAFAFYGVAGPVQIEVKKEGYRTIVRPMDVTEHTRLDFDLETEQSRPDFRGTYTLTISAAPCLATVGVFPAEAERRVYTASVAQDVGRITVTLSGADLIVTNGYGNRFVGMAMPDGSIEFSLGAGDFYYTNSGYYGHFDVVERFGQTAYMAGGLAIVTGTRDRLTGHLAGTLEISSRANAPFLPSSSECSAKTHGFEMVRQ